MLYYHTLATEREELINITGKVREAVQKSGIQHGICVVYCPHTTAAVTVNENTDPDVVHDLLWGLNFTYPNHSAFLHDEGNSAAHLKSSAMGCSETFIVENGALVLGTWQGIYFCEFDGPRTRKFYIKIIGVGSD